VLTGVSFISQRIFILIFAGPIGVTTVIAAKASGATKIVVTG
jgi:threonine dehydrogenase-like Zn-dependent dehydrogenase